MAPLNNNVIEDEKYIKRVKQAEWKAKIEWFEAQIAKIEEDLKNEKDVCIKHQRSIRMKLGSYKRGLKKFRYYLKMIEINQ